MHVKILKYKRIYYQNLFGSGIWSGKYVELLRKNIDTKKEFIKQ